VGFALTGSCEADALILVPQKAFQKLHIALVTLSEAKGLDAICAVNEEVEHPRLGCFASLSMKETCF
jgi:hypothetical protein